MTTTLSSAPSLVVLRSYRLCCNIPALTDEIGQGLRPSGWEAGEQAELGLLIDGPWGFALQSLNCADASNLVIVTDNPCPEYWEDLWEQQPRALLAGGHSIAELTEALHRAAEGERFRHTPPHNSPLTPAERRLLRLIALGWENKEIAQELGQSEGTVKNGLNRVFGKLGLKNRTKAALYYWGLLPMLEAGPRRCQASRENQNFSQK